MSTVIENQKHSQNTSGERKALGRGLAALLGNEGASQNSQDAQQATVANVATATQVAQAAVLTNQVLEVELSKIEPNPDQPRKHFNQAKLEELALSLKEHGLVQPIVVRRLPNSNFQIIAGERRWRASKLAGLSKIPVIVRGETKSQQSNDLASLIENIQREELSPVELANSYERMIRLHGFTQDALAQKLGVSRVAVANTIRLLKLPEPVKQMLTKNQLGEGHARALLGLGEAQAMEELANQILTGGLTVREVEARVKEINEGMDRPAKGSQNFGLNTAVFPKGVGATKRNSFDALEDELRQLFGTKVSLRGNEAKGSIELYFSGKDSLNRLIHQLRSCRL